MASSGEFAPEDGQDFGEFEAQPEYPTAFGVTFTPAIMGVVLAILGLAGAAYLFFTQVGSKQERKQTLQQDRDSLQQQIDSQPELESQLAEIESQLQIATVRQRQILGLLSSDETLETLLVDLEEMTKAINGDNADIETQLRLLEFSPQTPEPALVADGAFGAAVDNRIKRWRFDIRSEGSFVQVLQFIDRIERLQPLLIVRDVNLGPTEDEVPVLYEPESNQFSPAAAPRLAAEFTLEAILPASPAEVDAAIGDGDAEGGEPEAAPANN